MWCSCPILSFYRWGTWGSKRWSALSVVTQLLGGGAETRVPISPLVQGMNAKQSSDPKHWGILYFIKWTIYGNQPTTQLPWHTVGVLQCKIKSSLKIKCTQIASETRHLASLQQYKSLQQQIFTFILITSTAYIRLYNRIWISKPSKIENRPVIFTGSYEENGLFVFRAFCRMKHRPYFSNTLSPK